MKKVTNNKSLEFKSIAAETYREYRFPGGEVVRIDNPNKLNVNPKSGAHRVQDKAGKAYYIPAGWIALSWESSTNTSFLF